MLFLNFKILYTVKRDNEVFDIGFAPERSKGMDFSDGHAEKEYEFEFSVKKAFSGFHFWSSYSKLKKVIWLLF